MIMFQFPAPERVKFQSDRERNHADEFIFAHREKLNNVNLFKTDFK